MVNATLLIRKISGLLHHLDTLRFENSNKALNSYSERCNAMFRKRSDEEHQEGRSHFVILLLFDKAPCLAVEPRESYYK